MKTDSSLDAAREYGLDKPIPETSKRLRLLISTEFGSLKSVVKNLLIFFFSLYAVALTCSMAAMELLSWTTVLFTIIYLVIDLRSPTPALKMSKTGYGYFISGFILIASLGVFINAPSANWVKDLGALRDFLLFFFFFYSLKIFGDVKRLLFIILICGSIISIYGIWQHYTGIDIWRHDHRALMQVNWGSAAVYSTVGFFNHHLTYAYSYGMIICIAWAMILAQKSKALPRKIALGLSFCLIAASIICTYGRGAWIALAIALPVMTLITSRKKFFFIVVALVITALGLSKINPTFQERLKSVVSSDYGSNEVRKKLWDVNFQMFKDHPVIGVGYLENEPLSTLYYQKMNILGGMAGHAHSNYFEFLSTGGALGFISYMILILLPLFTSLKVFFRIKDLQGDEAMWDRVIILSAIGAQLVFNLGGLTQCTVCDSKVLHQFVLWLAISYFMGDKYKVLIPNNHPAGVAK